jgi:hypothetical protein
MTELAVSQRRAAGDRVAVLKASDRIARGRLRHQPPKGRVRLTPRVPADRAVVTRAGAGRNQGGGADGGFCGVPDRQRVVGVRVVAEETGP